jgi:retinol dehydrogenase-12
MAATRNILITGPTNGIGRETALALAAQGHKLFLLCRNEQLGRTLCARINQLAAAPAPVLLVADLGNTKQVRSAAERFLARNEPLHILINNAGVVNTQRIIVDVEGTEQEQMFAVNHLGHFLLTNLLLPRLIETGSEQAAPARIIVVSSEAHALFCKGVDFDDLNRARRFAPFNTYGQSKLANLLMVSELIKRVDPAKVQVNSLHPGAVNSNLGTNNSQHWYAPIVKALLGLFFISPIKGAQTSLYLATENITTQGSYYSRCKPIRQKPWALDEESARRLWQYSAQVLKLGE